MQPRVFKGSLAVENDLFSLYAERLIVRENSISVSLRTLDGDDNRGATMDVEIPRGPGGVYASGNTLVQYAGVRAKFMAALTLTRVAFEDDQCWIEGHWKETGEEMPFSGRLGPFIPAARLTRTAPPQVRSRWYSLGSAEAPWERGVYEVVGTCIEGETWRRGVESLSPDTFAGVEARYAVWNGAHWGVRAGSAAEAHSIPMPKHSSPPQWWRGLSKRP